MNPFEVLDLSSDATPKQIDVAYRKMAMKYHPDVNNGIDAEAKMKRINKAYEMILGGWRPVPVVTIVYHYNRGHSYYSSDTTATAGW